MSNSERYVMAGALAVELGIMMAIQISVSTNRPWLYLWLQVKYKFLSPVSWFILAIGFMLIMRLLVHGGDGEPWWVAVVMSLVGNAIGWYFNHLVTRRAAEILDIEYARRFPGACIICAWNAWGVESGMVEWSQTMKHEHKGQKSCRE